MALEIVTGYTGKPHITSQQDAVLNAASLATGGKYVLSVGKQLSYELKSNTLIRINGGYAINQGRLMGMNTNDYEELDISVGLAGSKRCDLIVIHYSKDSSTGIEKAELKVIEGTAGADYVDPEYIDNSLFDENYLEDDLVLYRVKINGLSIETIEQVANVWYLDTGERQDLVTSKDMGFTTGPPESSITKPYIRMIGNKVHLGMHEYCSNSDGSTGYLYIDKKYAPKKSFQTTLYPSSGKNEHYAIVFVNETGTIKFRWFGPVTGPEFIYLDFDWFLD
jgi:hypothetical protein|nr:MAG TPA: hypothetical protein [Caudoviricetes sp.]